ncbi:MAG: glycosyltransferase involved in cell wall biosynthesis [bacterium]
MERLSPLVSVLLPVRQWRSTTAEAVESLLAQSMSSLEILVIGYDDVQGILDRLPDDDRITGIARQGTGLVAALNTGLAAAKGSYIARMDDDDLAYPTRLEVQLDYLKAHPEVELCASRVRFVDSEGTTGNVKAGNLQYAKWLNALTSDDDIQSACYTECPMPHPTWIAHKSVWQGLDGYRDLDGPEDYDLILRAMITGVVMGKPEPVLQDWREHSERLTYTDRRYRREAFTRCRAWAASHIGSGLDLHKGREVWLCGTGRSARYWHDALEDCNVKVRGFVDIKTTDVNRLKREKPVISYQDLTQLREDSLVITALSEPAVRARLQRYFDQQRWKAGQEYILGA